MFVAVYYSVYVLLSLVLTQLGGRKVSCTPKARTWHGSSWKLQPITLLLQPLPSLLRRNSHVILNASQFIRGWFNTEYIYNECSKQLHVSQRLQKPFSYIGNSFQLTKNLWNIFTNIQRILSSCFQTSQPSFGAGFCTSDTGNQSTIPLSLYETSYTDDVALAPK